jgi:F0F1-type ATP synthase epsilon subunit
MANTQSFSLVVVSPETVLFEGQVKKLICPGLYQDIAILPDHTPLYAQLVKGEIKLVTDTNKTLNFVFDGGILRVKQNTASIIVSFDVPKI